MTRGMDLDDIDRLEEIRDEIAELLNEAKEILRHANPTTRERAERYWVAEIEIALGGDHEWLARSGHSMEETIEELRDDHDGEGEP